jgi:fructokinase
MTSADRVLVVGEALIDVVRHGERETRLPGGSPFNVAIGLARLGVATELRTWVGRDADGAHIARVLDSERVAMAGSSFLAPRTSSAIATIGANGQPSYEFDISWQTGDQSVHPRTLVLHTGSLAAFLPPGADGVLAIIRNAKAIGAQVSFDPNVRPAALQTRSEVVERFEALVGLSDIVKLSDEDAAWLYPSEGIEQVAKRALGLGVGLVVVTRGAEGSYFVGQRARVVSPAVSAVVVDTIGAGDAFMATLIEALMRGHLGDLDADALEGLAVRCGTAAALTVARQGADPPTAAQLSAALIEDRA